LRIESEGVLHFYWWRHEVPMTWQDRPVEVFEGKSLRYSVRRDGDECLGVRRWLVFADEVLPAVCALAGGGYRVTSCVPRFTVREVIVRILSHLGLDPELPTPVPARPPPQEELPF